jgi:hypothetical protein
MYAKATYVLYLIIAQVAEQGLRPACKLLMAHVGSDEEVC